MDPRILFEDDSIIVLDKPSGILVHSATNAGQANDNSLTAWLVGYDSQVLHRNWSDRTRIGIVHRLDQETSGVMVVAKTPESLDALQQQFRTHAIKKIYWVLVIGHPDREQGSVDAAIGRHPGRKTPMAVAPIKETARGKVREALTDYRVIEKFDEASLVEATLHTGRTHQVRLHMKYLGHPILGDTMYGTKPSQRLSRSLGITRQMLHAHTLGFTHPQTGQWQMFIAEPPADFQQILATLRKQE